MRGEGQPYVHLRRKHAADRQDRKSRRQHADDLVAAAVEHDRAADRIERGAQLRPPETVADNYDRGGALLVVVRLKRSTERRQDAEQVEQLRRHGECLQLVPDTAGEELRPEIHQTHNAAERRRVASQVFELGEREPRALT